MDRRKFLKLGATSVAVGIASTMAINKIAIAQQQSRAPDTSRPIVMTKNGDRKLHVSYLIFDGVTSLDFIGPSTALSRSLFDVDFVAKDKNPVYDDNGLGLLPTATFSEINHTDILCVPGTANPYVQIIKKDMIEWVAQIGQNASWVTSVCTGSFILGAAGLLKGYKASAHWSMIKDLVYFGAIPTHERVVRDRNRFTGGGVTSGIDFSLALLALLKGEDVAKATQLSMEYDPHPPFDAGSPRSAPMRFVIEEQKSFDDWLQTVTPEKQQILDAAANRLGIVVNR